MAECELLPTCLFFNDKMDGMPATSELVKDGYCRRDNSSCARFLIARTLGRPKVPADLFPNELARAQRIIASRH